MGHVVPDRLFWAQPESEDAEEDADATPAFDLPAPDTKH
jgi:hydroxymethylpyrimidine/phosphomethylpyrimidine kinase